VAIAKDVIRLQSYNFKGSAITFSSQTNILFLATGSISCYQCSSKNHTEVYCEDPMAPAYLPISKNCMVPKENHEGNFPANYCVKMIGISGKFLHSFVNSNGQSLVILW